MSEKFALSLNDFTANAARCISRLRESDAFQDVTLVGDDKKQINAHKVVLSSCSGYFDSILRHNQHAHPLLCLDGVDSKDLTNVMDYIYKGELKIYHEELDRFLNVARKFELEGLLVSGTEDNDLNTELRNEEILVASKDKFDPQENEIFNTMEIINDQKFKPVQNTNQLDLSFKSNMIMESPEFQSIEELDEAISNKYKKTSGGYQCSICNKIQKYSSHMKEHVELHFDGLLFQCKICEKKHKSRNVLRQHLYRHKL